MLAIWQPPRLVPETEPPWQVSKVSDEFQSIAIDTSGAWALHLAQKFSSLELYTLTYNVCWVDGSLRWSKVASMQKEGLLYEPGMRTALLATTLAERRRVQRLRAGASNLRAGDPLAKPPPKRGRGSVRPVASRGGRGRGQASRRQGSPQAVHGNAEELGAIGMAEAQGSEEGRHVHGDAAPERPTSDLGDEFDLCDLDKELENLLEEDLAELAATYDIDSGLPGGSASEFNKVVVEDPVLSEPAGLGDAIQEIAELVGLGAEEPEGRAPAEQLPATATSFQEATAATGSEVVVSQPVSLMQRLGIAPPSQMGYVYYDNRSVVRIQRGKPKGSISVKCYNHPGCSWLLSLSAAPSDDEIIGWLFEVPPPPEGTPTAEAKALTKKHLALVEKWRPRRGGAASSNSGGGAAK